MRGEGEGEGEGEARLARGVPQLQPHLLRARVRVGVGVRGGAAAPA